MKLKSKIILAFTILMTLDARAGSESHGGNAVVCYSGTQKNNIKSVTLFDYYEGAQTSRYHLTNQDVNLDYRSVIKKILNKLSVLDLETASALNESADRFDLVVQLVEPNELPTTHDFNSIIPLTPNCFLEQFAVQNFDPLTNESYISVNKNLWSRSDSVTKAGLILHESVLKYAQSFYGQENSDSSRVFNYMISSDFMNSATANDYTTLSSSCGFKNY